MKKRAMKKWIPHDLAYCEGCKWWRDQTDRCVHKREECQFQDVCQEDCGVCTQPISYCEYLHYREYGQYPLGDMCKVCGEHTHSRKALKNWW